MLNQNNGIREFAKLLEEGIYVQNLRLLQLKCNELAVHFIHPSVFFVLEAVFSDLRVAWGDRVLETKEYESVQKKLIPPIQNLIEAIENPQPDAILFERLDHVVREFSNVRLIL